MIAGLKPYPAYKDSGVEWLGEVPEAWRVLLSRRFCRVFAGATPNRDEPSYWHAGTVPWLASGDVNQRRICSANQFITDAGFKASSTKWIRPGSLVIALAGQGRTKGMAALVEISATCNQSLGVLEPAASVCNPEFLLFYLESRYRDIRGLVGDLRDGLNLEHLKQLPTPIPPLLEQVAIARFLNHVDSRIQRFIAGKKRLIALLDDDKRAMINRAFTRGLDPAVPVKPTGLVWLGELPSHWDMRRLRNLLRQRLSYGASAAAEYSNPQWPRYLRITDFLADGSLRPETFRSLPPDIAEPHLVVPGDVLFARSGATVGKAFYVDDSIGMACYAGYLIRARPQATVISPRFLFLFTQSDAFSHWKNLTLNTATIENIAADKYAELTIPLPPFREQEQIVEYLDERIVAVRSASDAVRRQIALIGEYRTRLISDVVTGRLDVREAAKNLPDDADVDDPALDKRLEEVAST